MQYFRQLFILNFTRNTQPVNAVLYCIVLYCVALRCVALRCVALRCVALRCVALHCIVLIAHSRCNRVFTRRLRLCHSHTVYRREVRKVDREGPNRVESEV